MEHKMEIIPKSKWIHVEMPFVDKNEKDVVLLPEGFRSTQDEYKAVSIVTDPEGEYKYGDVVRLPTHVIREIKIVESVFYFVERNHVMAQLK